MNEKTTYFVAAGLMALTAGLLVGSARSIGFGAVLMLIAAVVFAWLAVRKPTSTRS